MGLATRAKLRRSIVPCANEGASTSRGYAMPCQPMECEISAWNVELDDFFDGTRWRRINHGVATHANPPVGASQLN